MRILDNDTYRDMTKEEIEEVQKQQESFQNQITDSQRLEALENAVAESLDILKNLMVGENNV